MFSNENNEEDPNGNIFRCWIVICQFPTLKHKVLLYYWVSETLKAKSCCCRSQDTWRCGGGQRARQGWKENRCRKRIMRHGSHGQQSWTTNHARPCGVPHQPAELSSCGSYQKSRQGPIFSRVWSRLPRRQPSKAASNKPQQVTVCEASYPFLSPGSWSLT